MCKRRFLMVMLCGGVMLGLAGFLQGAVVGVGKVVMEGSKLVSATTADGYTVTAETLKNGTTTAPGGATAQYPPPLADDLDFASATSNIYPLTTVNFGGDLWKNTNGDHSDFFIFEAAGGKDVTDFRAIFPDDSVGQALVVQTAAWVNTGVIGANNFGTGQMIAGIAFSITDLRDAAGMNLPSTAVIKGIRVGQSNTGVDPVVIAAVVVDVTTATEPVPANGATDAPRDSALGWKPAASAQKHNVYFGTDSTAVANANVATPLGVLASTGQTAATYEPAAPLTYGQTYFWRVDEVNGVDQKITKGDVWSFTVEPYAYPIKNVTATASNSQLNAGPEKTVDGSGLNANDQHSTELKDMWLSASVQPNWIQFAFDKVYKLHELWVWNSNQVIETLVGFGAKGVTIEYSADGSTWTTLAGVPEFAQATALATYAHNTTVHFGGISARYVKLTINSSWSGVPQASLSEVRFFYVPVQARVPTPANAATGVELDATLNWRPGREAASHTVYLGIDKDAVANGTTTAKTVSDHSLVPASLEFGATYYWRVDEVNAVTYPGELWSFTTREFAVVEDFEDYTDEEGSRIYETWVDGWTNNTGSVVGYLQAPFAERTILHGGKQSMPLEYNNVKTPYYSEAQRTWSTVQDWTSNGATDLSLWFRGRPAAFLDKGGNVFTVSGGGHDIWDNADDFRFVHKQLSGNGSITARVDSLTNTNAWAKVGVMIRESLEAGSKHASMVVTPANSCSFPRRETTNGVSTSTNWTGTAVKAPYWVRITRAGNAFKGETSPDGKTWTALGADMPIVMGADVYIGLCVTSHDAAQICTAEFSNVATTGAATGTWEVAAIGDDPQPANTPESLYVAVEDSAGKRKAVSHPNPAATTRASWQQWRIPLADFTSAGVNMSRVKKLYIGVGDRSSPKPGGAGLLYIDDIGFGHPAQ